MSKENRDYMQQFSIKDLENYTGVKAHTIRIWEHRYGLLKPERTDSNIRKYSDDELKALLNISILNNRGHKISEIAKMNDAKIFELIEGYSSADQNDDSVIATLKLSMLNFDEKLFNDIIDLRIATQGLEHTFINVMVPFLREIGVLWLTNTICPAQEHFISNLIRQKIYAQIDKYGMREPKKDSPTYVFYLPEMEFHELSLLMLSHIFRTRGFKTIFLGQSVPIDDLLQVHLRVGDVQFVSIFTSQPASTLLPSYLGKLTETFRETNCTFHFSGYVLKDKKPTVLGLFNYYTDLHAMLSLVNP